MKQPTRFTFAAIAVALATSAGHASVDVWTFAVDAPASTVRIHVGKSGILGFAGHIHEVVAPALSGAVTVYPDGSQPTDVAISFDARALRVVDESESPSARRRGPARDAQS